MNLSTNTINACLELFSTVQAPLVLPDGSTNVNAPERLQRYVAAHQELLAALSDSPVELP